MPTMTTAFFIGLFHQLVIIFTVLECFHCCCVP